MSRKAQPILTTCPVCRQTVPGRADMTPKPHALPPGSGRGLTLPPCPGGRRAQ